MKMNSRTIKLFSTLCFAFLAGASFASEKNKTIAPIITQIEPVEIVVLCPAGSQHEGELVPKWVTSDEATEFFCNDSIKETEIGE